MPHSGSETESPVFRFGAFQFDASTLELTKNGGTLRLQTQPARLLRLLLSGAGDLVTREAIQESLWHDGINVDFEVGVNRCIRQLRAVLGDDPDSPRYIKTVPRFGYCFIAPVAPAGRSPSELPAAPQKVEAEMPSIAVLPFANLSGDPEDEYFSDGLTEEITNALAQIRGLKVIARTSAFAFKGRNEDVRQIASNLGVGNVLEGSVRRSGPLIRVTVQLIHAADGAHRSSKRYERRMTDIFALQDEISGDVAHQLRLSLGVHRHFTPNLKAYEVYLEGRFHWQRYSPAEFEKGKKCFEKAVSLDPDYGPAYTGIAQCCLGLVTEHGLPALDLLPKAATAAHRALELDETDAEAHAALGQIAAMLEYDWVSAERHFRRALALNPLPYVRMAHATWYLLPQGRAKEAVAEGEQVIAQDPLNLVGRQVCAAAWLFARDFDRAGEYCLRVLELDGRFFKAVQILSLITSHQGKFEESLSWAERLIEILGRTYASLWTLAQAHATAGNFEAARHVLRELENLPGSAHACPARIGLIYGLLGEPDVAFEWLDQAIQRHDPTVLWTNAQPRMDCLRPDLRFRGILEKLNLTP
jgi:TolB-like protein/Tfp pilus assembly protein PilF